jgi:hypothetical protein
VGSQSEEAEHPPPAHVRGPHNPAHGLSRRSGGERHRWRPQKCPAATWLIQHTGDAMVPAMIVMLVAAVTPPAVRRTPDTAGRPLR